MATELFDTEKSCLNDDYRFDCSQCLDDERVHDARQPDRRCVNDEFWLRGACVQPDPAFVAIQELKGRSIVNVQLLRRRLFARTPCIDPPTLRLHTCPRRRL